MPLARRLPWLLCLAAAVASAWSLSVPGEAAAASGYSDSGSFFQTPTHDIDANALVGDAAGTGTWPTAGGTVPRISSAGWELRIKNLNAAATSGDEVAQATADAMRRASIADGFAPGLGALGSFLVPLSLAVPAFQIGWKIGRGIDDLYARLSFRVPSPDATATVTQMRWLYGPAGVCASALLGNDCWMAEAHVGSSWQDDYCDTTSAYCVNAAASNPDVRAVLASAGGVLYEKAGSTGCAGDTRYPGHCTYVLMSDAQMSGAMSYRASESEPSGGAPPAWWGGNDDQGHPIVDFTTSFTPDTSTDGDASHLDAARQVVDGAPASVHTFVNGVVDGSPDPFAGGGGGQPTTVTVPSCIGGSLADCNAALQAAGFVGTVVPSVVTPDGANPVYGADDVINVMPGAGESVQSTGVVNIDVNPDASVMPMLLPQPGANETYDHYLTRLQALGYVGTVTVVDLDSTEADPQTGPSGVARIQVDAIVAPSATGVFFRAAWPYPQPGIAKDVPMTVYRNPPTTAPAPDPGPGPGDLPPSSGAIDFTPITSLNPGCKFPYGFVCYAKDVTAWFNVSPVAPDFNLPVHAVASAVGLNYNASYDVNLGAIGTDSGSLTSPTSLNDYMAIIRALESVALWVGAVYLIATRLLGFHASGDPGEAVDEAHQW